MEEQLKKLVEDLRLAQRYELPTADAAHEKIKCRLTQGARIWWYSSGDAEFWRKEKVNPRDYTSDTGIIVCRPDVEYRGGDLNIEECVVVQDGYQVEKCYPDVGWIALARLLQDGDVVEIFDK